MHIPSQAVVTSIMAEKYTACSRLFEFLYLSFADYILEHSEDDTKSLFSIIKVGGIFLKIECIMNMWWEHCEMLMRFSNTYQNIYLKFLPDYQWFVALQRFSQTRVWLPMEELQPCEEVHGKQSEMFIMWISVIDLISMCVKLNLNCWILQLHGRKQHIRALLIDRVMLQHEVGCKDKCIYIFF